MSREVGITAMNPNGLMLDGGHVFLSGVSYTKEWIEKVLDQNQDTLIEGRLILACSYNPHGWILKAVEEVQKSAPHYMHMSNRKQVCITDEDDIFAAPEVLLNVILKYWEEWHSEDPRWSWSQEMIREFFNLYKWAIIYIDVY